MPKLSTPLLQGLWFRVLPVTPGRFKITIVGFEGILAPVAAMILLTGECGSVSDTAAPPP